MEAEDFDRLCASAGIPEHNSKNQRIVVGCNYHTTWQSHKAMRFVLKKVEGRKAFLATRTTGKFFTTDIDDLIFIESGHNKNKANRLRKELAELKKK